MPDTSLDIINCTLLDGTGAVPRPRTLAAHYTWTDRGNLAGRRRSARGQRAGCHHCRRQWLDRHARHDRTPTST